MTTMELRDALREAALVLLLNELRDTTQRAEAALARVRAEGEER